MNKIIRVSDIKTQALTVIEYPANNFEVSGTRMTENNGYWISQEGGSNELYVYPNILLNPTFVDRMGVEFDILDSGNIHIVMPYFNNNGFWVSAENPIAYVPMAYTSSIELLRFLVYTSINSGIKIKRIWFDAKQEEAPLGRSIIVPPPKILVGNGYKHHHYSKPGMPAPYISGQVKHKGQPAQGTITMSTANNPEHIISTDTNGRYFYQTTSNRMQLTANSNWTQHNDIVRREVYPNTDIGLPDFVNKFKYKIKRSSNIILTDILVGLLPGNNGHSYYQFKPISDNGYTSAKVTGIQPTELLCLDWTMESEQNYDKFTSNDWNVSGYVSGTVALQEGQLIAYSKDGNASRGFDNVHFTAFKIVAKEESMATIVGYITDDLSIAPGNYQNMTTDFIDISDKSELTYEVYPSNPTNPYVVWLFFDANKGLVGSRQSSNDLKKTIDVIPDDAKFIRIGARYLQGGYLKIA